MASLKLTYSDVWGKLGEYLGITSSPSGSDLTKVKDLTKRGYRKFLMPIDMSNGTVYRWKFLEKTTTLSLQSDVEEYDLPIGFSSFANPDMPFAHTTNVSWNPVQRSVSYIYERKSQLTTSGYPQYFALKTGDFDSINGQGYRVIFQPTPSTTINYYYTYLFMPPAPEEDDDVFIGDDLTSEAILECCLAVAENNKYDSPNARNPEIHAKEAERLVQAMIGKDKQDRLVPDMGMITDGKVSSHVRSATVFNSSGTQILPE